MKKSNPVAQTPTTNTPQSATSFAGQDPSNAAQAAHPWHAHSAGDALTRLNSQDLGLSSSEADQRLQKYGPNQLSMAEGPSLVQRIWAQINNILILVLLTAAAITALIDHLLDSGVILAVVVLNITIGLLQEGKAEKALQAIRKLLAPHAVVWRDGRQQDIAAAELVPGDVVLVASGDSIPADLRFLRVTNLQVDESALTGESVPVVKNEAEVAADAPLGDRFCMGFAGTLVTQGQAKGIVVGTAGQTEMGRIGRLLETVESNETPLVGKQWSPTRRP